VIALGFSRQYRGISWVKWENNALSDSLASNIGGKNYENWFKNIKVIAC